MHSFGEWSLSHSLTYTERERGDHGVLTEIQHLLATHFTLLATPLVDCLFLLNSSLVLAICISQHVRTDGIFQITLTTSIYKLFYK